MNERGEAEYRLASELACYRLLVGEGKIEARWPLEASEVV
jgi:hypothetical protein